MEKLELKDNSNMYNQALEYYIIVISILCYISQMFSEHTNVIFHAMFCCISHAYHTVLSGGKTLPVVWECAQGCGLMFLEYVCKRLRNYKEYCCKYPATGCDLSELLLSSC